jgi:hypothetical protein
VTRGSFADGAARRAREALAARRADTGPRDVDLAAFVVVHVVEALAHAAGLERPDPPSSTTGCSRR